MNKPGNKIMLSTSILQRGTPDAPATPLVLRAGLLTMLFDPATGHLRHLRLGDHEIVRGIYGVVRNQNWATIPWQLSNLQTNLDQDSFRLSFDVACRYDVVDYFWRGVITGDAAGQVTYTFDGESRSHFQRNRIGLCVLHPVTECAGKPCVVEHTDGALENGAFPRTVAPAQPFFDIRALTHEVATTGVRVEIRFAGEIFEMEDQRNYTDASFKTYSTPQSQPKPAAVLPGAQVHHAVTLRLLGATRPVLPVLQGRPPQLAIATTPVSPLPPLGLCAASHGRPLTAREIALLKLLHLSHLRADLDLSDANFPAALRQAATEAAGLNLPLHLALTITNDGEKELAAFATEFAAVSPKVSLWLLLHETEAVPGAKWIRLAQAALQRCAPNVLIAAGAKHFFWELNNSRPPDDLGVLPAFAITPQVHLSDDLTLIENIAGQTYPIASVAAFSPRPAVLSPITLHGPWDSTALPPVGDAARELPPLVDPRQMSLFGAGWTLGSIANLAATGHVHSLTYFETTGWRGVMETESGPPLPEQFPSAPGLVFPIFHLLADIGEFPGQQIYPTHSSLPLLVEGLTLFDAKGRRRILVANLSGETLETKIKTGTCRATVRYLDETNAEEAMREPEQFRAQPGASVASVASKIELKLLPYALARIDIE